MLDQPPRPSTMLLFLTYAVSCVLGASSGEVSSRADDMDLQSLANVVQQQAATIQSLQARYDCTGWKEIF